jgi:hypothetical protein
MIISNTKSKLKEVYKVIMLCVSVYMCYALGDYAQHHTF